MDKLEEMGASVSYNDPYIPAIRMTREFAKFAGRKSVDITKEFDLLLIAAAHDEYRNVDFLSFGIPIVDSRHIIAEKHPLVYRA